MSQKLGFIVTKIIVTFNCI